MGYRGPDRDLYARLPLDSVSHLGSARFRVALADLVGG